MWITRKKNPKAPNKITNEEMEKFITQISHK